VWSAGVDDFRQHAIIPWRDVGLHCSGRRGESGLSGGLVEIVAPALQ